eukprot:TRINITY_DN1229_c0_g1::TRINITY_DN1229_c0_g1_i1::g.26835::m.26835 TRINITY_DN1229_c0_g1::TRINITY_DN1229_c0_g1_i1::g.26835  ORF type:complete len:206 (-),score=12.32,Rhabdo_ncap/PF00945.13/0.024 TRINITY_DN1229_c0_g1_i1:146-763(-)
MFPTGIFEATDLKFSPVRNQSTYSNLITVSPASFLDDDSFFPPLRGSNSGCATLGSPLLALSWRREAAAAVSSDSEQELPDVIDNDADASTSDSSESLPPYHTLSPLLGPSFVRSPRSETPRHRARIMEQEPPMEQSSSAFLTSTEHFPRHHHARSFLEEDDSLSTSLSSNGSTSSSFPKHETYYEKRRKEMARLAIERLQMRLH